MNGSEKGYRSEMQFGKELWMRFGVQPVKSSRDEDIKSHWDWKVQDFKYDVKSKAAIRRGEDSSQRYIWIEFTNVRGRKGWLFGEADALAFDRGKYWMIVNRQRLVDVLSSKLDWETIFETGSEKEPWKMYQRLNRQDGVMLVPVLTLLECEPQTWWKR